MVHHFVWVNCPDEPFCARRQLAHAGRICIPNNPGKWALPQLASFPGRAAAAGSPATDGSKIEKGVDGFHVPYADFSEGGVKWTLAPGRFGAESVASRPFQSNNTWHYNLYGIP
jgi:hypothetical protein